MSKQRQITGLYLKLSLYCLAFIALLPAQAFSQTYNFKTFSLDEGLSQSEISCMLEDNQGYLWLGTNGGGVCKFDGKEFQSFEEKDGLSGQLVTGLAEDKRGNIWISTTWGGISCYNGKKFLTITQKEGLADDKFDHIAVDNQNNIVLCSHGAVSAYDGKKSWLISGKIQGMSNNDVTCLYKDKKGNIWLGSHNGIFVLKGLEMHDFRNDKQLSKGEIISISGDEDGNIYFAKSGNAFYKINTSSAPSFGPLKASAIDSIQIPPQAEVSYIHIDRKNQFWICTNNTGLFKYTKGVMTHFDVNSGLPNNAIKNIYEDHSGCFWIGTNGSGFVRFMDQTFTYYDNMRGFSAGDVFALCCDRKNNIWAASSSQGIFSYDGQKLNNYNEIPALKGFIARSFFCDHKGNIWIGGPKGIRMYDGRKFSVFTNLPDSINVNAAVFAEDSYGNIWIGTRGQGAFCFNGTKTKHFNAALGLKNPYVYSICEDNSGSIWLGTGNGAYKYTNGKFQVYSTESGICNAYIGSMVKDKFGNLWMGTDNCVTVSNGKSFQSISTAEGLASGTVYLLNVDDYGNIWVGTNKGADQIVLNSNGQVKMIRNFGKTEGFKGIECNSRSTCLDNSGNVWFGTIKGVIRYNPREESEIDELPSVHIAKVRLFYENADWDAYSDSTSHWDHLPLNPALPYDKNHITFDFKAVNKTAPENIKYSFILKGFDRDWSPETKTPFATYSNLPPGHYTFRVKAANKRDNWNETPAEFSFLIKKPFWSTWWFISLCCLFIMACLYVYNTLRKKHEQAERDELEKVIQLRTFELTKQKEEKEVLLKEIHHRVKNNLQVINSLISIQSSFVEDPKSLDVFEECKNRIRAIALIHEKLYKSEDFGRINIKDYIQMLVQNMIQTYNINKKISLILDLKVEYLNLNTTVPLGLLLNEIISNSFKYAFSDMERGEIIIRLNTASTANSFVLIIGDNGKGYKGDPFEKESHPSLGLELVKILADQVNGKIEKIPMEGTYYKLIFHSLKN